MFIVDILFITLLYILILSFHLYIECLLVFLFEFGFSVTRISTHVRLVVFTTVLVIDSIRLTV